MDSPETVLPRPRNAFLQKMIDQVVENPVIIKELRGRMRSRRAFIFLTGYLVLISLYISLTYASLTLQSSFSQWDPSFRQNAGKTIFSSVVMLEFLMIAFIGPALTAGAITSERERQTYDLLRTTLLSARALVFGKLASAFMYLFLLILTALPIQALAFLLGGVGMEELLVSGLMLVVNAVFFCTLGFFFSSFLKRTVSATVAPYATILLSLLGLGAILFVIGFSAATNFNGSNLSPVFATVLVIVLWLLACTNPFSTANVSEFFLIQDETLFLVNIPMPDGSTLGLISPWILHVLLYLALMAVMIFLSIQFVKRPDR